MEASCAICERCPYCASRNVHNLPLEQVTQLRMLAFLKCCDCGTTFEPATDTPGIVMRPHIGDFVVRQRRESEGFIISLLGASASHETYCASHAYAIALARRAARPMRANVWETTDGVTFDLVGTYGPQ